MYTWILDEVCDGTFTKSNISKFPVSNRQFTWYECS